MSDACQIVNEVQPTAARARARAARFSGLPALKLRAEGLIPVINNFPDSRRIRRREDQREFVPSERLHLRGQPRDLRLDDLGLTDAAKTLSQESLQRP